MSARRALTVTDTALLAEAVACLALARVAVRGLPFRCVSPRLGQHSVARAPFEAHAWLRVGSATVLGGRGAERFAVVASFGDARP